MGLGFHVSRLLRVWQARKLSSQAILGNTEEGANQREQTILFYFLAFLFPCLFVGTQYILDHARPGPSG